MAAVHALRDDARPLRLPHLASTANGAASAGILPPFHAIGASGAPLMRVCRESTTWRSYTKPHTTGASQEMAAVHALRDDARPLRLPHLASTANGAASAGILPPFHAIGASGAPLMRVWYGVVGRQMPLR